MRSSRRSFQPPGVCAKIYSEVDFYIIFMYIICQKELNMITQSRLKELFSYAESGHLVRLTSPSHNAQEGSVVGCRCPSGYFYAGADGSQYLVHRLVFLYHHGYLPEHNIDHINRDKSDNRIDNLREATQQCNLRNSKVSKKNTSGVRGVRWDNVNKKWHVRIKVSYRYSDLGRHHDLDEAVAHRLAAEQCLEWQGCDSVSSAFMYMQRR